MDAQTSETTLQLGDFIFRSMEIPAEINFGGSQRLAVHQLIGGVRVIDAMGRSDDPLSWSGILMGGGRDARGQTIFTGAVERAQFLDALRIAGAQVELTWGKFKYLVVVREFKGNYKSSYLIPYQITCEVVQDETSPVKVAGTPPVDQAIGDDNTAATALASSIGDPTLSGLMTSVSSAISAVSSFATAAQSTINSVLQPITAAQAQVGVLLASATNTVANVTTFGGVLPGSLVSAAAAQLSGQAVAMTQLNSLHQLGSILGRMQRNLGSANSSPRTVATAGGNLFQIAERQYGDAKAWTAIAQANDLTDPFVQGTQILTIPPQPGDKTGVLNA
ncbi:MAG: hypothetical protein SHS37scaffold220_58 [Phage 67_12]|nr:MAG: hypothetical protein SHS37scaffold220_58 [Phage 67_12]